MVSKNDMVDGLGEEGIQAQARQSDGLRRQLTGKAGQPSTSSTDGLVVQQQGPGRLLSHVEWHPPHTFQTALGMPLALPLAVPSPFSRLRVVVDIL